MKRFIPLLMALLFLSGCGAVSAEKTYRQITMEEAVTMKRNYILAVFEVGCLCTLALRLG